MQPFSTGLSPRNCHICNSSKNRLVFHVKDFFLSGESFSIYECQQCHVRFTYPQPHQSEISRYYQSEQYYSHKQGRISIVALLYGLLRWLSIKGKVRFVKNYYSKAGKLLDIGFGAGHFLYSMHKSGWNCTGVEPHHESRNVFQSKTGITVYPQIEEIPTGNHFHLVTLWHVLEHFHDPVQAVRVIQTLQREGDYLIIALPNYLSEDAVYFREYWAAYDVPRHLFHFHPQSIKELLTNNSYHFVSSKGMVMDVFYISMLSFRYQIKSFALIRAFFLGIKIALLQRKSAYHSSIVYVFQKNTD